MDDIKEQIEWWKRQHCSNSACQLESEISGFIHTVEKLLACNKDLEVVLEAAQRHENGPRSSTSILRLQDAMAAAKTTEQNDE